MKNAIIIGANSYIARNLIAVSGDRKDIKLTALYDYQDQHFDGALAYKQIDVLDAGVFGSVDLDVDHEHSIAALASSHAVWYYGDAGAGLHAVGFIKSALIQGSERARRYELIYPDLRGSKRVCALRNRYYSMNFELPINTCPLRPQTPALSPASGLGGGI